MPRIFMPLLQTLLFKGRITSDLGGKHSFIPLACAECDNTLPFSGASSIPLCFLPFPSTLFHQLVFYPPSLHLAIHFSVYFSAFLLLNSYIILFGNFVYFHSLYMPKPMEGSIYDLIWDTVLAFAQRVWRKPRDLIQDSCSPAWIWISVIQNWWNARWMWVTGVAKK